MTARSKVPNMTLYPYSRVRCVEVDRKRYVGRKALMHPPSSIMRGSRMPNILKDSEEQIVRTTPRYNSGMHQME
jgi:hypothetical protein